MGRFCVQVVWLQDDALLEVPTLVRDASLLNFPPGPVDRTSQYSWAEKCTFLEGRGWTSLQKGENEVTGD
jgi:hypothetical protein